MKKTAIHILLLVIAAPLLMMASCEEEMIGRELPNTPTANFEAFWKTFDTHYGMFDVKDINWTAVKDQYKGRVHDQMSDEDLYGVFCEMITQFNDNHLNLYPTNGALPVFPGGILRYEDGVLTILKAQDDYDIEVARKYVTDYKQVTGNIGYGKLTPETGYINIKGTDRIGDIKEKMPDVLAALSGTSGIVVDVRGFYGGYDPASQALAGYFASSRKLYMTTRKRNGPLHTQFTPVFEWYAEPADKPYTKKIVLLTSRFTQSAGETFTLALKQYEYVTTVGDTTAGSFSDNPNFELPNGWMFSVSVGDYRAPDGTSYEGKGMPPNEAAKSTRDELLQGRDAGLEKAREVILR